MLCDHHLNYIHLKQDFFFNYYNFIDPARQLEWLWLQFWNPTHTENLPRGTAGYSVLQRYNFIHHHHPLTWHFWLLRNVSLHLKTGIIYYWLCPAWLQSWQLSLCTFFVIWWFKFSFSEIFINRLSASSMSFYPLPFKNKPWWVRISLAFPLNFTQKIILMEVEVYFK